MFPGGPTTCTCDACAKIAALGRDIIRRETDAALVNAIANHPEVKPTFGYNQGPTDLAPLFDHPDAYAVLSDGTGAAGIFEWSAPGVWQGHSIFLPESRGEYGIAVARAMCRWIFDNLSARLIWGMTPLDHRAAALFNRMVGFRPEGEMVDAAGVRCRLFVMEKASW